MKWLIAALISASLGFGLGWKKPTRAQPDSASAERRSDIAATAEPGPTHAVSGTRADSVDSWVERIRSANDSESLEALFHEIAAIDQKDYRLKKSLRKLIAARWVEVDPHGGLAFLESLEKMPTEPTPWPKIYLLTEWLLADRVPALAAIMALDEQSRNDLLANLTSELMKISPELCISLMKESGYLPKYIFQSELWLEYARLHPDEFRELALEIEAKNAADESRSRYVGSWIGILAKAMAHDNPEATFDWIDKELSADLRGHAMKGLLEVWAKRDPLAAAEHVDELKPKQIGPNYYHGGGSREITATIIKTLAEDDLQAAVELAAKAKHGITPLSEVITGQLRSGELSPQESYHLIAKIESEGSSVHLNVLRRMWAGLREDQLGETFEWLRTQEDNQPRSWAISGMVQEWVNRDTTGLADHLLTSVSAKERRDFLGQALSFMEPGDHSGSAEKLLGALPAAERVEGIAMLLEQQSGYPGGPARSQNLDIGFYADAILESPESPARSNATKHVAKLWGSLDPTTAFAWASELPPSDATVAMGATASGWAKYDTNGLSEHLLDMPAGSGRDAATAELVSAVREVEPDSAWQWSRRIDDADQRLAAQSSTIAAWAKLDPAAAAEAIATSDIPEETKEALQAVIPSQ